MVVTSGVSKLIGRDQQGHLESAGGLAGDEDQGEESLGRTMVWGKGTEASSPDSMEGSLLRGGWAEGVTMAEQGNEG